FNFETRNNLEIHCGCASGSALALPPLRSEALEPESYPALPAGAWWEGRGQRHFLRFPSQLPLLSSWLPNGMMVEESHSYDTLRPGNLLTSPLRHFNTLSFLSHS
uniref:Uncharacterized protein n=1 Tax=Capra hircus TaxID=9925 RepID=A0A8C2NJT0_CAPHI